MAEEAEKVKTFLKTFMEKEETAALSLRQIRERVQEVTKVNTSTKEIKSLISQYVKDWLERQKTGEDGEAKADEADEADKEEEKKPPREKEDDVDSVICELSSKRKVAVSSFKGKLLVSVREYYEKDGKLLPSSKGISLNVEQWKALKNAMPAVEEAIKKFE